jgi:zinc transport system ATP-binding protein
MTTAVRVSEMTVQFRNLVALEGIDFEIPENSFVSIVGPNGAGKSTLLKAMLGWPWSRSQLQMRKVDEAMKQVGALHLSGRPLSKLSAGELQRVYLARSMVREPKLILLDEPATGIDTIGEADMYQLLETYQKKSAATIVMITHDWHAATHHSDLVLLLNQKQISFGKPKDALAEENLRRAFGHIGHAHTLKF